MSFFHCEISRKTSSGIVTSAAAYYCGMRIGYDGIYSPTITVYDGTSDTGNVIVPTQQYDPSATKAPHEGSGFPDYCANGIYVDISCDGDVEVIIKYRDYDQMQRTPW